MTRLGLRGIVFVGFVGVVGFGGSAGAARIEAFGPVTNNSNGSSTITGRKYYCRSGSWHGALDVAAKCGKWMKSMLSGRRYFKYQGGYANTCSRMTTNYGNRFVYYGSNGYMYIQAHSNYTTKFGKKTRYYNKGDAMNYVGSTGHSTGAHVHAGNMRSWDNVTAWITDYFTGGNGCGKHPNYTTRVGKPRIS